MDIDSRSTSCGARHAQRSAIRRRVVSRFREGIAWQPRPRSHLDGADRGRGGKGWSRLGWRRKTECPFQEPAELHPGLITTPHLRDDFDGNDNPVTPAWPTQGRCPGRGGCRRQDVAAAGEVKSEGCVPPGASAGRHHLSGGADHAWSCNAGDHRGCDAAGDQKVKGRHGGTAVCRAAHHASERAKDEGGGWSPFIP